MYDGHHIGKYRLNHNWNSLFRHISVKNDQISVKFCIEADETWDENITRKLCYRKDDRAMRAT